MKRSGEKTRRERGLALHACMAHDQVREEPGRGQVAAHVHWAKDRTEHERCWKGNQQRIALAPPVPRRRLKSNFNFVFVRAGARTEPRGPRAT